MSLHAKSLPIRPLSRDARRVWLARIELHRRAGALTALHALVAAALLRRQGQDGRLDPSHDTLAHDAACCPRTVRTALRKLRGLGLLEWVHRLVRRGRVMRQTSNSYILGIGSPAPVAVATKTPKPPGLCRSVQAQLAYLAGWLQESRSTP